MSKYGDHCLACEKCKHNRGSNCIQTKKCTYAQPRRAVLNADYR